MKKFLLLLVFLMFCFNINAQSKKSDVFLQGFYWNSPSGGVWYDSLARLAPRLASAGFGAVWFPSPVKGAGGGFSMGYDPYDHYDFGEYLQKGSRETRFGSREELINTIKVFHNAGIQVFADAVLRHMMGGEDKLPYECRPMNNGSYIVPDSSYLLFDYPAGSGRFKKGPSSFYPNSADCFVDPLFTATDPIFRFGDWLDHNKASVRDSLIEWGKYLRNTIGFDGFRLDAVKSVDANFMASWLKGANGSGYAVAELWSSTSDIQNWCNTVLSKSANVAMFDFPLRYVLKDMCNNTSGGFDMTSLDGAGLVNAGMSGYNVSTFLENHDFDRVGWDGVIDTGHDPVLTNKEMGYAYTIFSEGRPCVFFKDYVDYGLGGKIDTLIWIRQKFLGGGTTKRGELNPWYISQPGGSTEQGVLAKDIYVAKRNGFGDQPGGFIIINDNPTYWMDVWVNSGKPAGTVFKDYTGHDVNKKTEGDGRVKLWAPPRSYTIYIADTTQSLNFPPVMERVPDQIGYTNSAFSYQLYASDANKDSLIYTITGNPAWLNLSSKGLLSGTPAFSDTAVSNVVIKVADKSGAFDADTFRVTIKLNYAPVLSALTDTTVKATKRFEKTAAAADADGDSLRYTVSAGPAFINIGEFTGKLSGTPAVSDTGSFIITVQVTDGKGAFDNKSFTLKVIQNIDTLIATYGKPNIDGNVTDGENDWLEKWRVVADSDTDSKWGKVDTLENEIRGIYSTWDADSLYIGVDYVINDKYNSLMFYIDAGLAGGVTNFNSTMGYTGDYSKNFRFQAGDGIDFFTAAYYHNAPILYQISGTTSLDISAKANSKRGAGGYGSELAVAWNDIYGLGAGLIPNGVALKFVAVVGGGFNYGGGDSAPDNASVDGNAGPDSLFNMASITPDKNNDGIPDPTVFIISEVKDDIQKMPTRFNLAQNYPNPFNPSTNVRFDIPFDSKVDVKIYNILGKEIKTLLSEHLKQGSYSVVFNAAELPSGVYFVRLNAGQFTDVKKMVLIK